MQAQLPALETKQSDREQCTAHASVERGEEKKKKETKNGRHMTGFYLFLYRGWLAAFRGNLWKRPAVRGITRGETAEEEESCRNM